MIINVFQKVLDESKRKLKKIWVDKYNEFYSRSMKSFLQNNDTEIYSSHNKGKSVIGKIVIRTLKNKIYKYMTSISKNVYIDKLDDIVNKSNNTYHSTIKMKPVDVKSSTYFDSSKENMNPKFKIGDIIRISKYKNIFVKGYIQNWSEEVFVIKKVKNTVQWICFINDLNGAGTFHKKRLQKTNQKEFRIEKAVKRKVGKLYVKCKECNNLFNNSVEKKDSINE